MFDNKFDIFFVILFMIVVSIIIGLNIVALIDKKISDVSVNIPPIKIPKPLIILKINGISKKMDNISICQTDHTKNDKNDKDNKNNKNIEGFIVADAHHINDYKKIRDKIIKEPDYFEDKIGDKEKREQECYNECKHSDSCKTEKCKNESLCQQKKNDDYSIQLSYPYDRIINKKTNMHLEQQKDKLNKRLYVSSADFGFEYPKQFVSCSNASVSQKWGNCKKRIVPSQLSCDLPNKISGEGYYRTRNKLYRIPLEDYQVRGYNYANYTNWVSPYKIHERILSQATKGLNPEEERFRNLPDGHNYAFHNTPAMRMP